MPLDPRPLPDERVERADERPGVDRARDPRRGIEVAGPLPALHLDRPQLAGLDELGDAVAGPRRGQPEVVAQVARGRDAHRARRHAQQDPLRLLERGRRRRDHLGREHALGQVVEALEPAPARRRDLPAPEQPLERALGVAPVPPRARPLRPLVLEHLARRDRAAVAHLARAPPRRGRAAPAGSAACRPTRRRPRAPSASAAPAAARPGSATPRGPSTRTGGAGRSAPRGRAPPCRTDRCARTAAGSARARAR